MGRILEGIGIVAVVLIAVVIIAFILFCILWEQIYKDEGDQY